jgi:hypothetical protein
MDKEALSPDEVENAIEIACGFIEKLQDHFAKSVISRNAIIHDYIIPWAREAESLWKVVKSSNNDDLWELPFYDFIDEFSRLKLRELGITEDETDGVA